MRKSPRFKEMGIIAEMRKYYRKGLVRNIKHEHLLGRQPKQIFKIFLVNLIWLRFCVFE